MLLHNAKRSKENSILCRQQNSIILLLLHISRIRNNKLLWPNVCWIANEGYQNEIDFSSPASNGFRYDGILYWLVYLFTLFTLYLPHVSATHISAWKRKAPYSTAQPCGHVCLFAERTKVSACARIHVLDLCRAAWINADSCVKRTCDSPLYSRHHVHFAEPYGATRRVSGP